MSPRNISAAIVIILSLLIALGTLRAFSLDLHIAFQTMAHQIQHAKTAFLLHISGASVALGLGAIQFIKPLRKRRPMLHRWIGRIYALAIAIGGISGLIIALQIESVIGTLGFAVLAILWVLVTGKAVMLARARKIAAHRRWMICSFALTFAAVTLRLQLALFMFGFAMPYEAVYPFLAWSCWVPNLLFALLYVRRYQTV
ncbi:MAG: DUF2306 domain-containing protein [Planktotalea sp.]|uniref:DUF2306 domain-containing protein n=1 Tax=Planktotalea sp. TaxID=2029877 RepID=UPI003C71703C